MEYRFSLIICTYNRCKSLERLLNAVQSQTVYPDEILIVDGSEVQDTEQMLEKKDYPKLRYYRVEEKEKGLTLQRNYGIGEVSNNSDFVCFLDDDIVPADNYFEELLKTYEFFPGAIATGGWIKDETVWQEVNIEYSPKFDEFLIDGYIRKLGQRNVLRKRLGLLSPLPPGFMPDFSHGFSTGFLPPSGKIYEVEFFMGGVSSYRKRLFEKISFSSYFQGYGLYEDMDFCLRASKLGKLYVNTAAKVLHLHEESGRPNHFKYGQMVIRNGKHVWKLKEKKPQLKARLKWYEISFLLAFIRLYNYFQGDKNGLSDFLGRMNVLLKGNL